MILASIGNAARPALDAWAARRIRKLFPAARTFVDLGCGLGGIGRRLGADLVDLNGGDGMLQCDIADYNKHRDVAVLSNVYEHLPDPVGTLEHIRSIADNLWMSFTPWGSLFGGHEFAPWHFFGANAGPIHSLGANLFHTSLDGALEDLKMAGWEVAGWRSRYFGWKVRNELLLWNIEVWAK